MPHLHVVRPSDANETLRLARHLLSSKNHDTNALILTRQDIPVMGGEAAAASESSAERGGYVARDSTLAVATVFATGSEVHVALQAAEKLSRDGVEVRVVALPCWNCFESQPREYRDSVQRRDLPSVSIEAGSTFGWSRFADVSVGIDTFGISAPGDFVLDYFNMNADAVVRAVTELIGER
jgi:transketolase